MSATPLTQLARLLLAAAGDLENVYKQNGLVIPSLNQSSNTTNDGLSDKLLVEEPAAAKAVATIVGVCGMITNMVQAPVDNIRWTSLGFISSSCIQTVIEGNVVEILRAKGGEQGLSAQQIAAVNGADARKLERILRYLSTIHIFRETSPQIFANNRNSLVLDCGLPLSNIRKPEDKIAGTGQTAAWCDLINMVIMPSSLNLSDVVLRPQCEHTALPFNKWTKTDTQFFEWLNMSENRNMLLKFNFGMGSQNRGHKGTNGFDWTSLPTKAVIVDVGGGQGFATEPLTEQFHEFTVIVQDQRGVVAEGEKFWSENKPSLLSSGRLILQENNFFGPQPVKDADVYFLRMILHDWDENSCVKILTKLREAASTKSKLLVLDGLIDYACPAEVLPRSTIEGANAQPAPEPLPSNYGYGGLYPYRLDLLMMHHFPGQERSVKEMDGLFQASGWKLVRVYRGEMAQYLGQPM